MIVDYIHVYTANTHTHYLRCAVETNGRGNTRFLVSSNLCQRKRSQYTVYKDTYYTPIIIASCAFEYIDLSVNKQHGRTVAMDLKSF